MSYEIGTVKGIAFFAWWLFLLRARWVLRWKVLAALMALGVLVASLVHVEGLSGDLVPLFAWCWSKRIELKTTNTVAALTAHPDFAQFHGPDRNGVLFGPKPPQLSYRFTLSDEIDT